MDYILFVRADVTLAPNAEEVMVRGRRMFCRQRQQCGVCVLELG